MKLVYRLWDKKEKIMSYEFPFFLTPSGDVWFFDLYTKETYPLKQEEFVVLLRTTAKDKEKKWIYEGDIIMDGGNNGYIVERGRVEEGFYLYDPYTHNSHSFEEFAPDNYIEKFGNKIYEYDLKIIGNIWSNPEIEERLEKDEFKL